MKKLVLVLALVGISINTTFSQESQSQNFAIKYDTSNDGSQIELKVKDLLLEDFPNVQNTGKFDSLIGIYLNSEGHPAFSQIKGISFPTELTSIIFPNNYFTDSQVARESVIILKDLLKEHNYRIKDGDFKQFGISTKVEGENLKIIIFISE
jgi:hypothetical protein